MLNMNEQELQAAYNSMEASNHHQNQQMMQSEQHAVHQVQLMTGHQHGDAMDDGSSAGIPLHSVHEQLSQHTITHTIQLHSTPTHLVEILVSSTPSHLTDTPAHNSLAQDLDLQPSLTSANNVIVVVAHGVNGIDDSQHSDNGLVTVVPIMNGEDLRDEADLTDSEHKLIVALEEEKTDENDFSSKMIDEKKSHDLRPRRKAVQSKQTSYSFDSSDSIKVEDSQHEEDINAMVDSVVEGNSSNPLDDLSDSDDGESAEIRKCVVCLRQRKFTEDIYDSQKQVFYHVDVLLAHLNIQIKKPPKNAKSAKGVLNTGICPECMDQLQRWHIFNCAIGKRHETAADPSNDKFINDPIPYECFEARVYRNYKKMGKVKEVFLGATHAHFARRHLTEKDWDFFCDHLFHSNSVKSEKSRELERFLTSREKLSNLFCLKCGKLIPNGKRGYTKHMQSEHNEIPVMYPCDICGQMFPEKDMTASTEDYYPHWISHFYFNKCDDCGKRFPTKRALGQHRHAVHKNRQVKCEKCGKVLANKMSLDLHLLRHLPENEKKKYMIKCKVCKKKIAQWNLKSHMATHNDERPWKCDHCDATFKMKGALVSHRDVVHFNLKNHVCSICNEAFKSASSLRGHVRRHEGRKDYKCDVCLKEYYTYSALKGHKVVHQTARDFICEICGKAFKKKKALEEHGTIHTGEKPHQCPICGREIRVKSNLYKHMKIHKKNPNSATNSSTSRRRNPATAPANTNLTSMSTSNIVDTLNVNMNNMIPVNDESMSSTSLSVAAVDIGDQNIINNNSVQNLPQTAQTMQAQATFLSPHFQNHNQASTLVHTIGMPHQDLISVPVQSGHFYNPPQYFGALDP